jgi:hypothetical protein
MLFYRKEGHPDGIFARTGQSETKLFALAREELVRNLNQNTGAVAGFGIATARTPVRQVNEDLNTLLNNCVALLTANAGHETHATGVMLMRRIVKALGRWQAIFGLPSLQSFSWGSCRIAHF